MIGLSKGSISKLGKYQQILQELLFILYIIAIMDYFCPMEKINDSAVELINAIYDSTFFKESHDNNGDLHSIINLCRDVQKSYYNNADIYFRVYETEKNFVILYEALEKHKLVEKFAEHVENYKNSLIEDRTKYFSILLDIIEENEISKNNKRSIFIYG